MTTADVTHVLTQSFVAQSYGIGVATLLDHADRGTLASPDHEDENGDKYWTRGRFATAVSRPFAAVVPCGDLAEEDLKTFGAYACPQGGGNHVGPFTPQVLGMVRNKIATWYDVTGYQRPGHALDGKPHTMTAANRRALTAILASRSSGPLTVYFLAERGEGTNPVRHSGGAAIRRYRLAPFDPEKGLIAGVKIGSDEPVDIPDLAAWKA
ncbi:hypothetical protein [Rhodococcoides fascians]|uniref:hypothetical protein n=1 Tax=Rhodococcoides fascians TaxID=1828 RepID=UPI00366BAC20